MPIRPLLPDQLAYLEPLRKQLRSLPADIRAEGMDVALLLKLLRERTKGLSVEESRQLLAQDDRELEQWLSAPERVQHPLQVLLFTGLTSLVEELSVPMDGEIEQPPLIMEFPPGARVKKNYNGWRVKFDGGTLFVVPDTEKGFELQLKLFNEPAPPFACVIVTTVKAVSFGPVAGYKRVIRIDELDSKQVDYVLQVPGGFASGGIVKKGARWDEASFEQTFHTIRATSPE